MNRTRLRVILVLTLLVSSAFAAWSWLRPYEWGADTAARCEILRAQAKKDQAYYWVDLHLKVNPGETHDLAKPVRLVTAAGRELEPADTTLAGESGGGTSEIWLKFWVEESDARGPMRLRINDGVLAIKSTDRLPDLGSSGLKVFVTTRW